MNNIYKIIFVGGVIGIGHLLSLALVPVMQHYGDLEIVNSIAKIESSFVLVVSILGFGLTVTTTRDVAIEKDWSSQTNNTLNARLLLSLILCATGVVSLVTNFLYVEFSLCLILSPVIALNLDFILYGRDQPIRAAVASFIRQALPLIFFLIIVLIGKGSGTLYFCLIFMFFFLSAWYVRESLGIKYIYRIKLRSILSYYNVALIGFVGFMLTFQRFGIFAFESDNIENGKLAYILFVLKIYLSFIAVRRMFIQTFYKHLLKEKVSNIIDFIVFLLALLYVFIVHIYSIELSVYLLNNEEGSEFIILSSYLVLAGSVFSCSDARLMLLKRDKYYVSVTFFSGIVFFSIYFYIDNETRLIYALIFSEFFLSIYYRLGLQEFNCGRVSKYIKLLRN